MPARQIAAILTESIGWNVNATYTHIKRCIAKNAIERIDPGFLCHALVSKQQVQEKETQSVEANGEVSKKRNIYCRRTAFILCGGDILYIIF